MHLMEYAQNAIKKIVDINGAKYDDWRVIEWIPFERFKDVKQIGRGGFGTIHYARWIDGFIREWDIKNQQWKRYGNFEVALKKFDNFVNFNDVFNEMEIDFKTYTGSDYITSIRFYGITQDPETHSFMIDIYELDIVHQEFHPGNILSSNFEFSIVVLPYIAPVVLSGDEEYTKAVDVYSFGIIAYERITGFPPYPDIPHNKDLAMKICNGLRPKIPFRTPKLITRMIMKCWDARVTHRPTIEELHDELWKYWSDYRANQKSTNTKTTTPLNHQIHPQTIYTSRLLDFSKPPKPKNEENFERELEELTKSMSNLCPSK
ncbi:hypothetical protein Glove_84g30 [Diversispora epigaea]|uniref:Protein kinase domain-containing protein n=1 Tax=Diversispora epigaea TaxID=1348612 RepID=A0A397J773_9GLOM|nr:hypothetical protein Glove_84g30 [Diversispora epigaea]